MTEPMDASDHYSENLIKLRYMPTFYFKPEVVGETFIRSDYGLPEGVRLYVYPQSLFKVHPNFDPILGELLRRDPEGRLILIDDHEDGYWKRLLYERFQGVFPDVTSIFGV